MPGAYKEPLIMDFFHHIRLLCSAYLCNYKVYFGLSHHSLAF